MNINRLKNNKGFTLVEALFAVAVLTFTITILMTIISNSLFSIRYSKDEITVNYLLQEVVDYIRNDRDTFVFLEGNTWEDFYSRYQKCSSDNGCYFSVTDNNLPEDISSCSDSGCPIMYYDDEVSYGSYYDYYSTTLYGGETNKATSFKRKITVKENQENNDEIIITVVVDWLNGGVNVERSLSNSITNWR